MEIVPYVVDVSMCVIQTHTVHI